MAHPLNELFELFDEGKLIEQKDGQLLCLYNICANCQPGDMHSRTKADLIAKLIIAELFRRQNNRLVEQVGKLAEIADMQKILGVEAGKQTDKLVRLTWGLVIISAALLVFAFAQIVIMLK